MSNTSDTHVSNLINENKKYFDENIRCLSVREVSWLQSYFTSEINVSFMSMGSTNLYEELINKLARTDNFKQVVYDARSNMQYNLVPDEYFQWFKDSFRAQIFILNFLEYEYDYHVKNHNLSDMIKTIYNFFDIKDNENTVEHKIILINNIYLIFETMILSDNYTKWLKVNETGKLEWTANYLVKNKLMLDIDGRLISEEILRDAVLASLDMIDYPIFSELKNRNFRYEPTANKELIIDKMKRAWSQQKYRSAGKTKKAYHLPLTKKTKAKLEKMAQVQGLSETAMLDILINRFYELDYVDVDGKDLY